MGLGPGTRIADRYVLEAELGRGGFATVFAARHLALDSLHAIKILNVPTRAQQKRLLSEGRAQARLRHPNIVAVTDVVELGGHVGLVLEFVEGPTLGECLEARRLTLAETDRIAVGILEGMHAAHQAGLIHRDLKPANVLLALRGTAVVVKVADFGLVRSTIDSATMTATGAFIGTPAYMSPEQFSSSRVDERSDIYSLGCILFELLTGARATSGESLIEINRVASTADRPSILELAPEVPPRLAEVVEQALLPAPDERPRSVLELLERWRAAMPASSSRDDESLAALALVLEREPTSGRAREVEVETWTPEDLEQLASLSEPSSRAPEVRSGPSGDTPPEAGRSSRWLAAVAAVLVVALSATLFWLARPERTHLDVVHVSDDPSTQAMFDEAVDRLIGGGQARARPLFEAVASREADNAWAQLFAGISTGFEAGYGFLDRAGELSVGGEPEDQLIRLVVESYGGEHRHEVWTAFVGEHPELPFIYLLQARSAYAPYFNRGSLRHARAAADLYLSRHPDHPLAYLEAIRARSAEGELEESSELLTEALARFPTSAGLLAEKANVVSALMDWPAALEVADKLLELEPNDYVAKQQKAVALFKLGQREASATLVEDLLDEGTTRDKVLVMRTFGRMLVAHGRIREGFALYERCQEVTRAAGDVDLYLTCVVRASDAAVLAEEWERILPMVQQGREAMADPTLASSRRDQAHVVLLANEAIASLCLGMEERSATAMERLRGLEPARYPALGFQQAWAEAMVSERKGEIASSWVAELNQEIGSNRPARIAMLAVHYANAGSDQALPALEEAYDLAPEVGIRNVTFSVAALVRLAELGTPEQARRALSRYDELWTEPDPEAFWAVRAEAVRQRLEQSD